VIPTSVIPHQDGRDAQSNTRTQSSLIPERKRTQSTPIISFEQSFSSAGLVLTASGSSPCSQEGIISPAEIPGSDQQHSQENVQEDIKTVHGKRPSFLKSYGRRSSMKSADAAIGPTRRKSLRDLLQYFRSNSFTPIAA